MADLGDTLAFTADLYTLPPEQGGIPVNATAATLTVTLPDGTTLSPAVDNPPTTTGRYSADYVSSPTGIPGRYVGQWVFTLPGGKTTSHVETFDVGGSLVTTDEASAHLRAVGVVTKAADLEQLQWLCMVASDAVERDLGRKLTRQSITETHDGGWVVTLHWTPVLSVTSVSVAGTVLAVGDYTVNATAGIVHPTGWGVFAGGRQNVSVTYVAGYTDPPRVARMVALNVVQSLWQSSQQASHPLLDESDDLNLQDALSGLPEPIKAAYERLRVVGVA